MGQYAELNMFADGHLFEVCLQEDSIFPFEKRPLICLAIFIPFFTNVVLNATDRIAPAKSLFGLIKDRVINGDIISPLDVEWDPLA